MRLTAEQARILAANLLHAAQGEDGVRTAIFQIDEFGTPYTV